MVFLHADANRQIFQQSKTQSGHETLDREIPVRARSALPLSRTLVAGSCQGQNARASVGQPKLSVHHHRRQCEDLPPRDAQQESLRLVPSPHAGEAPGRESVTTISASASATEFQSYLASSIPVQSYPRILHLRRSIWPPHSCGACCSDLDPPRQRMEPLWPALCSTSMDLLQEFKAASKI